MTPQGRGSEIVFARMRTTIISSMTVNIIFDYLPWSLPSCN
jgi:hypothetical protein